MIQKISLQFTVAVVTIAILVATLLFAFLPFLSGLFGALIFYVLLRPMYTLLRNHGWNKYVAGWTTLLASIIFILGPLLFVGYLIVQQVILFVGGGINLHDILPDSIVPFFMQVQDILTPYLTELFFDNFTSVFIIIINILLLYVLLYYLLVHSDDFPKTLFVFMPFSKKHSERFVKEFESITYGTVVGTGAIAVIEGILIGVAFYVVGFPGALLWGVVAGIASIIPVLGPVMFWIPATIYLFLQGHIGLSIFMLIIGLVASNIEYLIRPYVNRRYGRIHPVTTLTGIIVGVPLFGILGLVIGPLLVSFTLLTLMTFHEQYVE